MWFFILILAAALGFAQESNSAVAKQNSGPAPVAGNAADTSSANQAVFADINIFSQLPLGSVFILWSNLELEADIKRQITSRSFALEPYFMQNIDREQFEQKRMLHLFEQQKREFFKLFPDEEEDE
jgi:hypothetical protein